MIKLGDYNKMTVVKEVDFGLYLDGGDEGEILLPKRYVPEGTKPGDELEVFVYLDQEERPVATTEHPLCKVGDFAYLEVSWVNEYGAFLNWGLMKDLSFRSANRSCLCNKDAATWYTFTLTKRHNASWLLPKVATLPTTRQPQRLPPRTRGRDYYPTEDTLRIKVIADNRCPGLIYDDQIFEDEPHAGDVLSATVVNVRPDGKLDLSLQRIGKGRFRDLLTNSTMNFSKKGGFLPYSDHSSPEELQERFGVSKKTFKRALGTLYKNRVVIITDKGIQLVQKIIEIQLSNKKTLETFGNCKKCH